MIMSNLIIGAVTVAGFAFLLEFVRRKGIVIKWWQWLLTVLAFLYTVFVLEVITGFLSEGAPRAALVMGGILGLFAVIWGVLLLRFVFKRA
jgi:hypothetical protein